MSEVTVTITAEGISEDELRSAVRLADDSICMMIEKALEGAATSRPASSSSSIASTSRTTATFSPGVSSARKRLPSIQT